MSHIVRFIRDTDSGLRRAVCSCGQSFADRDKSVVEAWARKPHERTIKPIPPEKVGFQSGLPDELY